jgi:hypothetical protein
MKYLLAFILHPKVSAVKYFPLELIKPNDQIHFSDEKLFDWISLGWVFPFSVAFKWCPLVFIVDLSWCPFWLIDGFFIWVPDNGINDEGNLTGGFGLNWKENLFIMSYYWTPMKPECRMHGEIILDQ